MMDDGEGPIHVHPDETLADLIPRYLENRRKDVERLRAFVAVGDLENVRVLGHSMAGSGGGYGFPELTRIGRSLERASQGADTDAIQRHISELEKYLGRLVLDSPVKGET
jgi:HPt (histidine-containing phosphotransfer) domain-containing protein